jgi:hypothetical protein
MAPKKRKSTDSKPAAAEPAKKQAKGSAEPAKQADGKLSVGDVVPNIELLREDEETVKLLVRLACGAAAVATVGWRSMHPSCESGSLVVGL